MYQKILAAMDTSTVGDRVFATALNLAKLNNSHLKLLHVLSPEEEDSPISFGVVSREFNKELIAKYRQKWEDFEKQCLEMLQSRVNEATTADVSTEFIQAEGVPGKQICKIAEEWGAELIVMGRRGHSVFSELVIGSVSSYVIHRAKCSVLVVQD
ncbi:MAG: universal stress protein [Okeania sp. SIO2F4]|uniref:universal stress protein n=1 Tax=Okeania sp. SIO2F4 TaxID=2607790 RepID=UPI00142A170A|nr:universal stress protein [Okeania sp. SIO2F4]NES02704.1 universal stress protein [Okeania sp. SIO2F4]